MTLHIVMIVAGVVLTAAALGLVIYMVNKNSDVSDLLCVSIVLIPASLLFTGIYGVFDESEPAKVYERKVKAADKADKELQKFLIDYPEFVTEETEADD